MEIRTVALIGLGAMGVFFAPRLEEHLGKEHFFVIAQGERRRRLETRGVTVNGVRHLFPIEEPSQTGRKADLIIISTKDMGLGQAIEDIRNFVGEQTQILAVLNGIDSEERVAEVYGWEHVLYSFMRMSIVMKDGVADFDPYWGKVHFGEAVNETFSPRVLAVKELFERCDIPYSIEPDMKKGMWFKFMCNIGENMTCALLGIPFGMFRRSSHANAIRRGAMREVAAIARSKGIDLGEAEIEMQESTVMSIPFPNKPSTLQDLEANRRTEIELFAGTVIRLGQECNIPTPVNWMFYHGIKVLEEKNMGMDTE